MRVSLRHMDLNLSNIGRLIRWVIGVVLLAWAIAGGPWWTYLGLAFLITGSWGFSPVTFYRQFKANLD